MPKHTLEHAGMVKLIVLLYQQKGKPTDFTTLQKGVGVAIESLRKTIDVAIKTGLVEETKNPIFPYESRIILTQKGQRVGEHLTKVLSDLKSQDD